MRQVRSIQHLTWLLDNWALSLSPCCCLASLDTSLLCLHRAGPVSECGQPGPVSGQSGQPGLTDWRISRRLHSAPSLLSTCVCLPLYLTAAVPPRSDSAGARWWSHKRRRPGRSEGDTGSHFGILASFSRRSVEDGIVYYLSHLWLLIMCSDLSAVLSASDRAGAARGGETSEWCTSASGESARSWCRKLPSVNLEA